MFDEGYFRNASGSLYLISMFYRYHTIIAGLTIRKRTVYIEDFFSLNYFDLNVNDVRLIKT
jgi:hypothetical protein